MLIYLKLVFSNDHVSYKNVSQSCKCVLLICINCIIVSFTASLLLEEAELYTCQFLTGSSMSSVVIGSFRKSSQNRTPDFLIF